jgi:hypothetical protein
MTSERKEIVFRGGVQRTVWRRISTSQPNDAWDLCCMTLILIESMKPRFTEETKPDYFEPKAAEEENGKPGKSAKPQWGAMPGSRVLFSRRYQYRPESSRWKCTRASRQTAFALGCPEFSEHLVKKVPRPSVRYPGSPGGHPTCPLWRRLILAAQTAVGCQVGSHFQTPVSLPVQILQAQTMDHERKHVPNTLQRNHLPASFRRGNRAQDRFSPELPLSGRPAGRLRRRHHFHLAWPSPCGHAG